MLQSQKNQITIIVLFTVYLLLGPAIIFLPSTTTADDENEIHLDTWGDPYPKEIEFEFVTERTVDISGGPVEYFNVNQNPPYDVNMLDSGGGKELALQDVSKISFDPWPTSGGDFDPDMSKNGMVRWKEDTALEGEYKYTLTANIRTKTYKWTLTEADSGTPDETSNYYRNLYLRNDWDFDVDDDGEMDYYYYWPENENISAKAISITSKEATSYGKIKAVYDWILLNIDMPTYQETIEASKKYLGLPKPPQDTLNETTGDVDDQAYLMASLLRSVGVPAWLEIGAAFEQDPGAWVGTCLLKIAIPLKDSGKTIEVTVNTVMKEFLLRSPFFISEWEDSGGTVIDDNGKTRHNLEYAYTHFNYKYDKKGDEEFVTAEATTNNGKTGFVKTGTYESGPENTDSSPVFIIAVIALSSLGILLIVIIILLAGFFYLKRKKKAALIPLENTTGKNTPDEVEICRRCGWELSLGDSFCGECGEESDPLPPPPANLRRR